MQTYSKFAQAPHSTIDIKSPFNKLILWKLVRHRPTVSFNLCKVCSHALFQDKEKFSENGDRIGVRITLCTECVEKNIEISDMHYNKKQHSGNEDKQQKEEEKEQVTIRKEEMILKMVTYMIIMMMMIIAMYYVFFIYK
jgi:hypothetical protein